MYLLCNESINGRQTTETIFHDVVSKLKEIGITVKTSVTDLGTNFVLWWKKLGIIIES